MNHLIKKALQALLLVPVIALGVTASVGVITAPATFAADCTTSPTNEDFKTGTTSAVNGANCAQGTGQTSTLFGTGGIFTTITNVLLYVIGAISVIMLIIGGIRYVVSGGDSGAVTSAKNTIMYAIIGIIVALLAYALVNFVLTSLSTTDAAAV